VSVSPVLGSTPKFSTLKVYWYPPGCPATSSAGEVGIVSPRSVSPVVATALTVTPLSPVSTTAPAVPIVSINAATAPSSTIDARTLRTRFSHDGAKRRNLGPLH